MEEIIGRRIFLNIKRPKKQLIDQFRGIPSSNIGDVAERLFCTNSSLRPMNKAPMAGTAFTVKCPAGDNMMFHMAMDLAQPGDILVVDGQGSMERALAGEIMMRYCKARGLAGVVVEGCIRDKEAIQGMDFPVYCKGITPQGPYKNGPGEINVPVCAGGQVILPGDILIGDQDGIVVIHPEDGQKLLRELKEKVALEERLISSYKTGILDREEHERLYRQKLEALGYQYYDEN